MLLTSGSAGGSISTAVLPTIYGRTAAGVAFNGHSTTSTSTTTSFGTAYSDRECWVVIGTMSSLSQAPGGYQVSSVSIGGNAATIVYQTSPPSNTNLQGIAFARYRDNGSLGTGNVNVTINYNYIQVHSGFIPYATTNTTSIDDTYQFSGVSTTTSGSITYSGGLAWIVDVKQNSTSSSHPSPWVNDYSFDYGTGEFMTVAQISGYTPGTYTVAQTSSSTAGTVGIASLAMI